MKNKAIDGLRGLAAFNVAISHFLAAFLPMFLFKIYPDSFPQNSDPSFWFTVFNSPPASLFYNGHFPVLLFFVMSGYVLAKPAFEGNQKAMINRFLGRYLRLNLPIAAAITLSFTLYSLNLYYHREVAPLSGSVYWFTPVYPEGLTLWQYLKDASYNSILNGARVFDPPLWSLGVEFKGSMLLFIFYFFYPFKLHKAFHFVFLTTLLIFIIFYKKPLLIYYFAIFAGAVLNIVLLNRKISLILFWIGLYFAAFQTHSVFYNFLPSFGVFNQKDIYNLIGAVLITTAVLNGVAQRFLETRFVQFLGRISFSLYLLHFIILASLSCWIYLFNPQSLMFLAFNFCIYVGVIFLLSHYFEKYIDRPSIRISHAFAGLINRKSNAKNH